MRGLWRLRKLRDDLVARAGLKRAEWRVAKFPTNDSKRLHGLSGELIVSLTSYPPRFPTLSKTLRSLLDQNVTADRTILWIAEEHRDQLPPDVLDLAKAGLEIRQCEDFRSYKKLVPALGAFPNAYIVTADDDLYYRPDWLERLTTGSKSWPDCIIAHRAHLALLEESGHLAPYSTWEFGTKQQTDLKPTRLIFPTGVAGILYPPSSLDPGISDAPTFMSLCPSNDDIWFFWMAMLAGTRRRTLGQDYPLITWEGSQETALYHQNWLGPGNDKQIRAMEDHFGKLDLQASSLIGSAAGRRPA